jgi:hypothetical protein
LIPSAVLTAVLPMHVLWMRDCVTGIIRRRARRIALAKQGVPAHAVPVTPLSAPLTSALLGPTSVVSVTGLEIKPDSRFLTPRPSVRARAAFDRLRARLVDVRAQEIYARLRDPDQRASVADEGVAALRRWRERLRRPRSRFTF